MANGIRQTTSGVVETNSGVAQTVISSAPPTLTTDGFEDYSTGSLPPEWTAIQSGSQVTAAHASNGSQSLEAGGQADFGQWTTRVERTLSSPLQPAELTMSYYEDQSVRGIAVRFLDSSNEELFSFGTANPQAAVYNGSGTTLESSPSPNYNAWRRFTATLDFSAGTFDVLWEDLTGSTGDRTATGLSFNDSPQDVSLIQIGADGRGPRMGDGGPGPAYIDDISAFA